MIQSRKAYLDVMKFLAIVLVVLGHCMQKYINNYTNTILYNFVWLFQMPAFFFISGYLHIKEEKVTTAKDMWKYIFKRFKAYFIPIVTFVILNTLINYSYSSFKDLLLTIVNKFSQWPFNIHVSLWFLFVLMLYSIYSIFVTHLISKQRSQVKKILIAVALVFLFEIIFASLIYFVNGEFLGAKLVVYYSIYFLFGYIVEIFENSNLVLKLSSKFNVKLIVFIFSSIISLFICIFVKGIANFSDTNILQLIIRVFGSMVTVISLYLLLKMLFNNKSNLFLSKLGQYTLEIYYIHIILNKLIVFAHASPNYYESTFNQWGIALLTFIIILTCSYIINFVIQYIPYLHYIIFGTKENKLSLFNRKEVEQCKN